MPASTTGNKDAANKSAFRTIPDSRIECGVQSGANTEHTLDAIAADGTVFSDVSNCASCVRWVSSCRLTV